MAWRSTLAVCWCLLSTFASPSLDDFEQFVVSSFLHVSCPVARPDLPTPCTVSWSFRYAPFSRIGSDFGLPIKLDQDLVYVLLPEATPHLWRQGLPTFCEESDLRGDDCDWLTDRVHDLHQDLARGTVGASEESRIRSMEVCATLSHPTHPLVRVCLSPSQPDLIVLPSLMAGEYAFNVEVSGGYGSIDYDVPSMIVVEPLHCAEARPIIHSPRLGSRVSKYTVLNISIPEDMDSTQLCLMVDDTELGCQLWPSEEPVGLVFPAPGIYSLTVWPQSFEECKAVVSFEHHGELDPSEDTMSSDFAFVTGASQRYFDREIIQNLIGSIHTWEPHVPIELWDFGLEPHAMKQLSELENVQVFTLPSNLPEHVRQPGFGAYAAKPFVTRDALNRHKTVLWIDANAELRRPLHGILSHIHEHGAFFVTHPFLFPTPQFHHPSTVEQLGCTAPDSTLPHCATTFMGFTRAHPETVGRVLDPLVSCAFDSDCVFPPGSSRANHRQEQTALNAILCSIPTVSRPLSETLCLDNDAFRLTADSENRNHPLQPTTDPKMWNSIVLFTRRDHLSKPYAHATRRRVDWVQ